VNNFFSYICSIWKPIRNIKLFNEGNISNRNCKIDKNKLLFLDKLWKKIDSKRVIETYSEFAKKKDLI
jgi:hypothetical protein